MVREKGKNIFFPRLGNSQGILHCHQKVREMSETFEKTRLGIAKYMYVKNNGYLKAVWTK